ncbi:MAG: SDR family oxidoreductase [Actinobacteria bacterium]|nr:SDR family oxidoreductase [Actinomycetota bacterium]
MDLGLAGHAGVITGAGGELEAATARLLRAEGAEVREAAPGEFGAIGDVDFLVSFAGGADVDDLRAAHELAVMAPLRAMKAIAPLLAEHSGGRIVNVCPSAGSVAGAATLSLSRLFADRYAKQGVLVNALCPDPATDLEATAREIAFLCSPRASHVAGATW